MFVNSIFTLKKLLGNYEIKNGYKRNWVSEWDQGGKAEKNLPHHPLVLCWNLPNDHGHLMKYSLNSRPNFEEKKGDAMAQ